VPGEDRDAVVVPASRYPHGYASVRSFGRTDVHTIVAVSEENLPVTASRYCDEVVRVPPSHDILAYRDALLGIAARPEVRTILPHRPQGPYVLSKFYDTFDRHVDLVVPPLDTLKAVHDRKRLAEIAEDAGVAVPETRLLKDAVDWDADRIVKSRYNLLVDEYVDSFGPGESHIAKPTYHFRAAEVLDTDGIRAEMRHEPIVQEYVDGTDEYVFGALYDHGDPLATFQHRQLREDSYTGGGGVYRETVDVPELAEAGRAILDELEWHGLACIEYIEDAETGEFSLVEINPRTWQSLACATRAGADFPYWYWLQATGRPERIYPEYEVGVGTHYLFGELEHLVSVARKRSSLVDRPSLSRTALDIARSWFETTGFDYLHLDDPLPVVRQALTAGSGAIDRRIE